MYENIPLALKEAEEDPSIVFVVITGNGDFFSSGNDLSNYMKVTDDPEAEIIKGSVFLE
jgi:peroxisomal 3,2-trans-enoyl-CoA isomerase